MLLNSSFWHTSKGWKGNIRCTYMYSGVIIDSSGSVLGTDEYLWSGSWSDDGEWTLSWKSHLVSTESLSFLDTLKSR